MREAIARVRNGAIYDAQSKEVNSNGWHLLSLHSLYSLAHLIRNHSHSCPWPHPLTCAVEYKVLEPPLIHGAEEPKERQPLLVNHLAPLYHALDHVVGGRRLATSDHQARTERVAGHDSVDPAERREEGMGRWATAGARCTRRVHAWRRRAQ